MVGFLNFFGWKFVTGLTIKSHEMRSPSNLVWCQESPSASSKKLSSASKAASPPSKITSFEAWVILGGAAQSCGSGLGIPRFPNVSQQKMGNWLKYHLVGSQKKPDRSTWIIWIMKNLMTEMLSKSKWSKRDWKWEDPETFGWTFVVLREIVMLQGSPWFTVHLRRHEFIASSHQPVSSLQNYRSCLSRLSSSQNPMVDWWFGWLGIPGCPCNQDDQDDCSWAIFRTTNPNHQIAIDWF